MIVFRVVTTPVCLVATPCPNIALPIRLRPGTHGTGKRSSPVTGCPAGLILALHHAGPCPCPAWGTTHNLENHNLEHSQLRNTHRHGARLRLARPSVRGRAPDVFRAGIRRRGEMRDHRENPPTSSIARRNSHVRNSGSDSVGNRTRFALVGSGSSSRCSTAAPARGIQDHSRTSDPGEPRPVAWSWMLAWVSEMVFFATKQLWYGCRKMLAWVMALAEAASRLLDMGFYREPEPPPGPAYGPPAEVPDIYWERLVEAQQQLESDPDPNPPTPLPPPLPSPPTPLVDRDDPEALEAALLAMEGWGRRRPRPHPGGKASATDPNPALGNAARSAV
ncbi:hypothetical protein PR048_014804 [Dryococelus australis]|uniref:Uncharacterized protein n=1 Tax=Dryococelus australis TaxID=614101 RepID=A0ABQ9HFC0_9NEOP|nr:hypothetical protein PR048_014804 [Dryococelus australis]